METAAGMRVEAGFVIDRFVLIASISSELGGYPILIHNIPLASVSVSA